MVEINMGNFIGLAFSTLKKAGIDTKNMSIEEVINKYNEINSKQEKQGETSQEKDEGKSLTSKSKNGSIYLPKKEYAQVAHALATKYANKSVKATAINIENTKYFVKNVKPGYFEVVDKIDIEEYRNLIELLEEKDD